MKTHLQLALRCAVEGLHDNLAPRNNNHFLVTAIPKSGSTYLSTLIRETFDCRNVDLVFQGCHREQELHREALILNHRYDYVAHAHARYHAVTRQYIESYGLRPVVLVRNIFDAIASMYDHLMKHDDVVVFPMANFSLEMRDWPREKALRYICKVLVPWCMNFYITWQDRDDKLLLTYDELIADTEGCLRNVAGFAGINVSDAKIGDAIDRAQNSFTRKNAAVAGRGKNLPDWVHAEVNEMAQFFPNRDLTPLGLDTAESVATSASAVE